MADGTIDSLAIKVSYEASSASAGVDALIRSLTRLQGALTAPVGRLGELADRVRRLSNAVSGMNVEKLRQLGTVRVSQSVGRGVMTLADAVRALPEDSHSRIAPLAGLAALTDVKISSTVKNVALLGEAVSALPEDAGQRLGSLAPLASLAGLKLSSTVPGNVRRLGEAVAALPDDAGVRVRGIVTGLSGLRVLDGVSITKAVSGLRRLPEVLEMYEHVDVQRFAEGMRAFEAAMRPLAGTIERMATAVKALPPSMRTAGSASRTLARAERELGEQSATAATRTERLGGVMRALNLAVVVMAVRQVARGIASCVKQVSNYVEDMNLYAASMGSFAEQGAAFAQQVQTRLGVDAGEWMRFQGVLQSIGTGFGITSERMATMSQNMTQLGYDIASFYNLDVDEAMRKVQSGFAGELEPMRRIGYDLSVARMQIEATNLGIEKQVSDMTQAEKAALRYHLMMTQLTQVQGDMARTISSPANQLRVLQAQLTLAARAIGNLFIPMLNLILPYAIAAAKAIQMLANAIARFFGLDVSFDVDYGALDGVQAGLSDGADAAADLGAAAKDATDGLGKGADTAKRKVEELKRSVMGFDELNKLAADTSPASDASSGASGAGSPAKVGDIASPLGSVLDQIPLDTYDFMKGIRDHVAQLTDEIAQMLYDKVLPAVLAVAAGFAAWKLSRLLGADLKTAAGLALGVAGAAYYAWHWLDAWVNGIDYDNLDGMLLGAAAAIAGFYVAFGPLGGAIAAVVTGLGLIVVGIHDVIENGMSMANLDAIIYGIGITAAGVGVAIGTAFGSAFGMIAGGIAVVAGGILLLVMGFNDLFQNGATAENVRAIAAGFMLVGAGIALLTGSWIPLLIGVLAAAVTYVVANWDKITEAAGRVWEKVKEIWGEVKDWFWEHVGKPVSDVFHTIFGDGEADSDTCKASVIDAWNPMGEWFSRSVMEPVKKAFGAGWATVEKRAGEAWSGVKTTFSVAGTWFLTNVATPIKTKFEDAWSKLRSGASETWKGIRETFSGVARFFGDTFGEAWRRVKEQFSKGGQVFSGVVETATAAFRGLANVLVDGFNWAIAQPLNALNDALSYIRGWRLVLGGMTFQPFEWLGSVPIPQIPHLADGRYGISAGQLFVAREAGPEMVGTMGGRTTVANNAQIVEGIEAGVTRGVLQALAMGGSERGETRIEIPLVIGTREIARAVYRGRLELEATGEIAPSFA